MKSYKKTEREDHIARWKEGGLSKSAYAQSVGIQPTTFYTWFNKPEGKQTGFIELRQKMSSGSDGSIRIEKGNLNIYVPLSVGGEELRTIVDALGGIK